MTDRRDPITIRCKLLKWYDTHQRAMPWRSNPEPWAVWVSEIMLQQTRVESVIEYFHRFMARYPTPQALAASEQDELMGYWAGLGYYARARNLHRAATQVVEEHGGKVPDDPELFAALSGVGRYTCGAVQSIAFGRPLSVVDGNVIRVLARLDHVLESPKSAKVKASFWNRADELLDRSRPGDFNQALMELGATVCTPRKPKCLLCPLQTACIAVKETNPETLPVREAPKARPTLRRVAVLSMNEAGHIWLGRRPAKGLLGGLWALPSVQSENKADLELMGVQLTVGDATIVHAFTHQVWHMTTYRAQGTPSGGEYECYAAFSLEAIADMGIAGPSLKAMRKMGLAVPHRRGAGKAPRNT
jgi:A/G-specific adenine glycosylase